MEAGFDNSLYIHKQTEHIRQRIAQWGGKLYLEFGGKLFDDYHAARVLPGFDPNGKIRLLYEMREQAEIIFTVSAGDIEKTKMRADLGISYDMEVLRLIDDITHMGIRVNSVVITQYTGQAAADGFAKKLTMRGVKNYIHRPIKGYPTDIAYICSDEGYGANPYIETSRPLVVVTAPGPGSGKLATCLSQVYHEIRQGRVAGYAKFETFPIWNLPLKHPVNLAYEAATADLADVNMIDPFHLEAYGVTTVNYNRDVEAFPIVRNILSRITGDESVYKSPTDMGVNMAGYAIVDDEAVRAAASEEIIPIILEPILKLKIDILGSRSSVLKVDDVLAALSITAATNTLTARAMAALPKLRDCEMHSTCMLHSGDEGTLRKMGLRLTSEPEYPSKDLFF